MTAIATTAIEAPRAARGQRSESLADPRRPVAAARGAPRVPDAAARYAPHQERRGQVRRVHRPRELHRVCADAFAVRSRPSIRSSFAVITTLITVPLAFGYAYAIQRTCIPAKGLWRSIALIPILAPSMLAALSFIYLFGNQGVLKAVLPWFGLTTIYGLPGMVVAMTFSAFPHAVMILLASLALADARLYEAADSMGTHGVATISHGHAARRQVRPHLRGDGRVHHGAGGIRRAQDHRRPLPGAGGRRLQAGDRPAELPDGRGRGAGAAPAGRGRVRRRLPGAPAGSRHCSRRAAFRTRRGPRAGATSRFSRSSRWFQPSPWA